MNYLLKILIVSSLVLCAHSACAQQKADSTTSGTDQWRYIDGPSGASKSGVKADSTYRKMRIAEIRREHENYTAAQTMQLRKFIKERTEKFEKDKKDLSSAESISTLEKSFEEDKKAFAATIAERIKAHKELTESQVAFWKVREDSGDELNYIGFDLESGIAVNLDRKRKYRSQVKTESNFTMGSGYNFISGDDLDINDFSYGNNEYFGLGYQFSTAISKNQKWRFNYGLLYQSYGVELNGNRIFSPNTSETQVVGFDRRSRKRKFRQDQLVIPLQLEFGGTSKREYEDGRIRYERFLKMKAGIGGYVGLNLSSRLKLKYEENGRDIKQTLVNAFDTNILAYGVDAYVGWDNFVFFGRMGLNPIFKSGSVDAQYVAFGIRLQ